MKRYEPCTPIPRRNSLRLIQVVRIVRLTKVGARKMRLALLERRAA